MYNRIITLFALLLTISISAIAQELKKSNVHIGFIYPISSNGISAKEYTNTFSVHAIAGVSGSEEAFCASGIANIVMNDAKGLVAAGVANFIHDSLQGVQAAGFINMVKSHTNGLQAAGFVNLSGSLTGAQLTGFANIAEKQVDGAQLAGFINCAKESDMQGAGFVNIAGKVSGVQVGGFVNVAKEVNTQVAGFINIAGKVKGAQVAGFINIADSSEYPIGLVNIIKKGEKSIGITIDESLTAIAALRSGGRILYGIVGAGYNFKYGDDLFALEAGLGAHLPVSKHLRINAEVTCTSLTDFRTEAHFKSTIRILPALKIGRHVEIFAGPTFNMASYDNYAGKDLVNNYIWSEHTRGNFYGMYIGAMGGVQLRF